MLIDSYLISEFPVLRSKANQKNKHGMLVLLAYELLPETFATLDAIVCLERIEH